VNEGIRSALFKMQGMIAIGEDGPDGDEVLRAIDEVGNMEIEIRDLHTKLAEADTEVEYRGTKIGKLEDLLTEAEVRERRLKEVFETLSTLCWEGSLDEADFQDVMEKAGLFVEVPASKDVREEYDTDTMFALEWKVEALAATARTEEPNKEDEKQ